MKSLPCKLSRMAELLICAITVVAVCIPQLWAADFQKSVVFSLDIRDEPLGEVVKKISDITGYQIMISPEWRSWHVNTSLKNVKIDNGLRQVVSGLNYFIVFKEKERQIAIIIDPTLKKEEFGAGKLNSGLPGTSERSAPNPKNLAKPADIQVIPPEGPGGVGITQEELTELEATRSKIDPDMIEVVPPVEIGGKGLTAKEIKPKQSAQIPDAVKFGNLVPPDGFKPK